MSYIIYMCSHVMIHMSCNELHESCTRNNAVNQSGGIYKLLHGLPGIYGNVNQLRPRAAPSGLGWFTAINPWPHAITITNIRANPSYGVYVSHLIRLSRKCYTFYFHSKASTALLSPVQLCI